MSRFGRRNGRFITFEGGEGAGKSTQLARLAQRLRASGIEVVTTREPGGTAGAEIIRHIVLSGMGQVFGKDMEALLFAAARDDHVTQVIAPALAAGKWVLCDRFTDSTRAYQGRMAGVDRAYLDQLQAATIGDFVPDLTLVLDVSPARGLKRAATRRGDAAPDRFEAEDKKYHTRLRAAFRKIVDDAPKRCVLIDGAGSVENVSDAIWEATAERFGLSSARPREALSA